MKPHYQILIEWAVKHSVFEPGVQHVEIRHDDDCNRGRCSCDCVGYFPHSSGLHEVALIQGEAELISVDGVRIS